MTAPLTTSTTRIHAVDFLRGLVMILMAIDHVRVYSGLPPGGPEPGIFFTRWVTHFCAPVFVFLCGTSAYLYWQRNGHDTPKLRTYLITRGAVLVILELTVIRFFWTFNLDFSSFVLAGVIWMIGWCMILLALLTYLKPTVVGVLGLAIIFFQDAFALVPGLLPASWRQGFGMFWEFIYSSGFEAPPGITILYVIVPWIGVMAAGYGFAQIFSMEPPKRKLWLLGIGLTATLAFIVVGTIGVLTNAQPDGPPFIIQLLNQRKYPASQLFLLMTLGPAILAMPFVEKLNNAFARAVKVFGAVPFFYYLAHILIIHVSSLLVMAIFYGTYSIEGYNTAPYTWIPEELHWNLSLLYIVFLIDVVILYFLCLWYLQFKAKRPSNVVLKYI